MKIEKPDGEVFKFESILWKHSGKAAWVFASLPQTLSKRIRKEFFTSEEGWGRLRVVAQIGQVRWSTAIWFDTKKNCYLLPLKSEVRKKEKLFPKSKARIQIFLERT